MNGLYNIRNTCCVNALVQCLRHSPSILKALKNSKGNEDTPDILRRELMDVNRLLEKTSARPDGLINAIFTIFKRSVVYGEQIDIDELWMLFVDRLESELGHDTECTPSHNVHKKAKVGDQFKMLDINSKVQNAKHMYNKGKTSLWLECVQGTHLSVIHCTCGFSQANIEVFTSVNLEVPEKKQDDPSLSIVDLLNNYTSVEKVDHWKCDKCSKTCNASKKINIWDAPDVIIITLKRFKMMPNGNRVKTTVPVQVDEKFSMEKDYQLVAIGQHHGSYDGGHYTAICKSTKHWLLFDDLEVRDFGESLAYDPQNVYFLIYEAINE